jgi:hypothetical protein
VPANSSADVEQFQIARQEEEQEHSRKPAEDQRIADGLQRADYGHSLRTTNNCDGCHVETTSRPRLMCRWARPLGIGDFDTARFLPVLGLPFRFSFFLPVFLFLVFFCSHFR